MAPLDAVLVEGVGVTFGTTSALDAIDLRVPAGTTLGVLGPNGAGKTTLIRAMTTAIRPDRGRIVIDGVNAAERPDELRRRIGVTGQYAGLDDHLTTVENIELVGRLIGLRRVARDRATDLVERFDLVAVADRRVGELSGGIRRRVDLAASLVGSPKVLFLDEPTTGLDPAARQALWLVVEDLVAMGATVVLTTQYLEEADRLADQIVVLDHGHLVAQGTPEELKALVGGKVLRATIPAHRVSHLPVTPVATERVAGDRVRVSLTLADPAMAAQVVRVLADDPTQLSDLDIASPSLDDVFFHLATTGSPT